MSSTTKMVLFFAAATVFNIGLMVVFIAVIIVVLGLLIGQNPNPVVFQIVLFVGFLASIVLTFLIYGWVMKKVTVKWQLEKHIPQLFRKKR
jgi:archaellum biogenesis protein FlaJ (TadC family)